MKHVSILVPVGGQLSSIDGAHQLFTEVNNFLLANGKPPFFAIQLIGLSAEIILKNGLFKVTADSIADDVQKTDLIIIPPAFHGDLQNTIKQNQEFIPWIIKHHKAGAEIVSLCIGAFIFAATGILNGRKCSTNWMLINDFRTMFPDVKLVTDKIMTDEHGTYTSGGGFSYVNLLLYLTEKYVGREAAVHCAKVFQVEIDRNSQAQFIIFKGQKEHSDDLVKKAQEFIEHNYQEAITIEKLATMLAIGRRSLEMRFKKATANTIVEYQQRVKVEAAKNSFETSRKNVNEVTYEVGYSDVKTFRTVFKKITGISPFDYRSRYNH